MSPEGLPQHCVVEACPSTTFRRLVQGTYVDKEYLFGREGRIEYHEQTQELVRALPWRCEHGHKQPA